ncbi:class I SAM-dependent methyltransferase [bacterium]|jgi:ubiquinone/menaquinone biosynthesis C-methylase UbiE|nr:class I SAM-dependent methyltransferase [bacterium]
MTHPSSSKRKISDYKGYDYKKDFWDSGTREYENRCEHKTIQKILKKLNPESITDIGCGFGRLYPTYSQFGKSWILLDYAHHLLKQASQSNLNPNTTLVSGSFYDIPIAKETTDCVLSIRTMHHMTDPERFFQEAWQILRYNGHLIIEIPNKRHIKNILKALPKIFTHPKSFFELFSDTPLKLNDSFYNFNPTTIIHLLKKNNFKIEKTINTSFFRSVFLKKRITPEKLTKLDMIGQSILSWIYITPSIYVICKKK